MKTAPIAAFTTSAGIHETVVSTALTASKCRIVTFRHLFYFASKGGEGQQKFLVNFCNCLAYAKMAIKQMTFSLREVHRTSRAHPVP